MTDPSRPSTRAQSYGYLQSIQQNLNFPGELMYDQIRDNGCGLDRSSWLALQKVCTLALHKIYKGHGSAEASLREANRQINALGWGVSNPDADPDRLEYVVTHRYDTSLLYEAKDHRKPRIRLDFMPHDDPRYPEGNPDTVRDSYGADVDIPISGDEYLYGIVVVWGYRE